MSDTNVIVFSGRLTKDPESRKVGEKTKVQVALANNRKWGPGKEQEDTCFMDIEFWGGQADVIEKYCKKGSSITVVGRLQQDRWTTDEGQKRSKLFISATDFSLGPKEKTVGAADDTDPALVATVQKVRQLMTEHGIELPVAIQAVLG